MVHVYKDGEGERENRKLATEIGNHRTTGNRHSIIRWQHEMYVYTYYTYLISRRCVHLYIHMHIYICRVACIGWFIPDLYIYIYLCVYVYKEVWMMCSKNGRCLFGSLSWLGEKGGASPWGSFIAPHARRPPPTTGAEELTALPPEWLCPCCA